MKPLLLLSLLLFTFSVHAQLSDKQLKELHDNTAKIESTTVRLNEMMQESQRVMDSINLKRFTDQNARNLDAFMANRKEQEKKQQKRLYWRAGFGILMLVILIIGWRRKKKAATV